MKFTDLEMSAIRRDASPYHPGMRMQNNWVLVQVGENFLSNIRSTASGLLVDISWNKEENAIVHGIVKDIPQRLIYRNKPVENIEGGGSEAISQYDADLEVMSGDKVYFDYLMFSRSKKNALMVFDEENQVYFGVRYDKIYCAMRGDKVIACNGHILIKRVKTETSLFSNHIEIMNKGIMSLNVGIAEHVGAPVRKYFTFVTDEGERYVDHSFVNPGDTIFFFNATGLSNELFKSKKDDYLKCQERHVIARVRKGKIEVNDHALQVEPVEWKHEGIVDFDKSKMSGWLKGKVICAPEKNKWVEGQEVFYQKTWALTFDYQHKEHNFVSNTFSFVEHKGNIFVTD